MSRYLTLIRHAKSSWNNPTLSDFERPLNKRGLRDAPAMGQWLNQRNIYFDQIVSSPAQRAITTAQLIAQKIHFPSENILLQPEIYDATVGALQKVTQHLDNKIANIALVGHNPGMSGLADWLCREDMGDMPTCCVVQLKFEVENWQEIQAGSGTLLHHVTPKKIRDCNDSAHP